MKLTEPENIGALQLVPGVLRTLGGRSVTPEEFVRKWPGARSQMQAEMAQQLAIPEASRHFLVRAGLPVDVGFNGLGFDLSGPLRRLPDDRSLVEISRPRQGGAVVCIHEAEQGPVVQLEPARSGLIAHLLNSCVERHAAYWLAWRTIIDTTAGQDGPTTARLLRQAFAAEDAAAIAGDKLPWSILLHEVELGVL